MKVRNIEKIGFAFLVATLFLNFIPVANALSIGISPSEKSVEVKENEEGVVYFAISQGSKDNETITISADVDWLKVETESFDLEPMGQKYVKFTISPLSIGNYTGKVKASASLSGVAGIKTSVTAKLVVSVSSSVGSVELEEMKSYALVSISNAQSAIQKVRGVGGNSASAESVLTTALEEFDKGNYEDSKKLGDLAYSIALEEYQKTGGSKIVLEPIKFAFIVIGIGATVVLCAILIEMLRLKRGKKSLEKAKGITCPKCNSEMYVDYEGALVTSYVCLKCGHKEIKEKYGFK